MCLILIISRLFCFNGGLSKYSTGFPMFKKDADGTYSLGWKNEACHNAFDNYFDLLFESGASYY